MMSTTELQAASNAAPRTKKRSQLRTVMFRFKKNKLAMFGLCLLILLILLAVFAPLLASYEEDAVFQNIKNRFASPSGEHWFGTDQYGRDVFARIIYGAQISLTVGITTVVIALTLGSVIGATAGYYGGRIENILMRLMDVFLAIPQNLMAISIVAALGTDLKNLMIALTIANIPRFSRIVRSSILSIRGQEFIEAARACGTRDGRIIAKHIIPNAIGPIIVQATLSIGHTIISIAGLSFIGLGIQPPQPEWGTMLAEAKSRMREFPLQIVIPGAAIMITVLALNLLGDGLRDALDPKMKN